MTKINDVGKMLHISKNGKKWPNGKMILLQANHFKKTKFGGFVL